MCCEWLPRGEVTLSGSRPCLPGDHLHACSLVFFLTPSRFHSPDLSSLSSVSCFPLTPPPHSYQLPLIPRFASSPLQFHSVFFSRCFSLLPVPTIMRVPRQANMIRLLLLCIGGLHTNQPFKNRSHVTSS